MTTRLLILQKFYNENVARALGHAEKTPSIPSEKELQTITALGTIDLKPHIVRSVENTGQQIKINCVGFDVRNRFPNNFLLVHDGRRSDGFDVSVVVVDQVFRDRDSGAYVTAHKFKKMKTSYEVDGFPSSRLHIYIVWALSRETYTFYLSHDVIGKMVAVPIIDLTCFESVEKIKLQPTTQYHVDLYDHCRHP